MSKHNVVELSGRERRCDEQAELISAALEVEVRELLSAPSERRDEAGRDAALRSGYQPEREIQTGISPVMVKVLKIRSIDGKPVSFRQALVSPNMRMTASLETVCVNKVVAFIDCPTLRFCHVSA